MEPFAQKTYKLRILWHLGNGTSFDQNSCDAFERISMHVRTMEYYTIISCNTAGFYDLSGPFGISGYPTVDIGDMFWSRLQVEIYKQNFYFWQNKSSYEITYNLKTFFLTKRLIIWSLQFTKCQSVSETFICTDSSFRQYESSNTSRENQWLGNFYCL